MNKSITLLPIFFGMAALCLGQSGAILQPVPAETIPYNPAYATNGTATAHAGATLNSGAVVMNIDTGAGGGCAGNCVISNSTGASATWSGAIFGSGLTLYPASHTLSVTVTDSLGNTFTSSPITFYVYEASENCTNTMITATISCMEHATGGSVGPSASVTLSGPFAAGDVLHTAQFFLRPASPYSLIQTGISASATSIAVLTPSTLTFTGTAVAGNPVITGISNTDFCGFNPSPLVGRAGQSVVGTGFVAGTTVLLCVTEPGTSIQVYPAPTVTGTVTMTIGYTWPTVTTVASVNATATCGTGYAVGDILSIGGGGSGAYAVVTSVGAGGCITGVDLTEPDPVNFYTSSGYSNAANAPTTAFTGSGSGATLNIIAGFVATVTDQGYGPGYEKFLVTAISAPFVCGLVNCNTFTIQRGFAGTFPIAHTQGGFAAYNPGPYPALPLGMHDTAGNNWIQTQCVQTEFTDNNTVQLCNYVTSFTLGTAAAANAGGSCGAGPCDTVTFTNTYAMLGLVSHVVTRYRGLGAISGGNIALPTNGYAYPNSPAFNNSMALNTVVPTTGGQGFPVTPGDLCVITAAGSPFLPANVSPPTNAFLFPRGSGTTGMVSVTGSVVTWVSGPTFSTSYVPGINSTIPSAWQPGSPVVIGGVTVHIADVITSSTSMTTIEVPPQGSQTYFVADRGSLPNPANGWVERAQDPSRIEIVDNIATSSVCNGGAFVHDVDGMFTIGISFHPASSAPQSVNLTTGNVTATVPAQAAGNNWRVDFEIHDWAISGWSGTVATATGGPVGAQISMLGFGGGDVRLQMVSATATGPNYFGCQIPGLGPGGPSGGSSLATHLFAKARLEEFATASTPYDVCQVWDINGNLVYYQAVPYVSNSGSNSTSVQVAGLGSGSNLDTGFFRIFTSTVAPTTHPPVNADALTGCLVAWNFEGNTNDSCTAGPYNGSGTGTAYLNTPGTNLVVPVVYSRPFGSIPPAEQWLPNNPTQGLPWDISGNYAAATPFLDATQSYSDISASPAASCVWTKDGGSPAGTITSPASLTSTVTGAGAGDFNISITCTDGLANSGSLTVDIGAISMTSVGQVTTGNPDADFFFGPIVALGANPFGYEDYWNLHASNLRGSDYKNQIGPSASERLGLPECRISLSGNT